MHDEHDLIFSPLQQTYRAGAHQVQICIYRMPDSGWTLEVIDAHKNSTVWEEAFDSDDEALATALEDLRAEGIDTFVGLGPGEPLH